jgi:hypothetical protein
MGKISGSGSGMNNSESLEIIFGVKNLKFFDADPGCGIEKISDPGWKKFGSGIRDKHPGSATLLINFGFGSGSALICSTWILDAAAKIFLMLILELHFRMLFYLSRYVLILFSYFTSF